MLRKRGLAYETIDRKIQHITEAREWDRRRLLDSALWINEQIVKFVRHGWTIHRATELFFLGMFLMLLTCKAQLTYFSAALSLTSFIEIHNDENSTRILEHLKTNEFVKCDYSDCLGHGFTIPVLIVSLLDANTIKLSY